MIAFVVAEGIEVKVIQDGKEWSGNNFKPRVTKKEHVFFAEDLIVDPLGLCVMACKPGCVTVGSGWASKGWYGFQRDGYAMMVPGHLVVVR